MARRARTTRTPRPRRTPSVGLLPKVVAALAVVALVAGLYAFWPRHDTVTVTGDFSRAVGLYPGSDVRILGVHVGKVDDVVPQGDRVLVTFEYDAKYRVPADAKAAVVAPSLVSDRYIQLFPAYTDGAVMRSGAHIPLDHTAVPVELDRISQSLDQLLVALGPTGANKNGAFQDLLHTGARNLAGQGQNLHDMNHNLSLALSTLAGGRNDLFSTVKNLQTFTTMLATNDGQVRRLNSDLANVSGELDAERGDLAAALRNLAIALNEVSSFVHDNRAALTTNIRQLASVTGTVAAQRNALSEALTNAPVALSNLQNAYDPATGTLDTRANVNENLQTKTFLCDLIVASGQPASACTSVTGALKPVTDLLNRLKSSGVQLPTNLLSAVPGAQAGATPTAQQGSTTVQMRGADPTLGGLLKVNQ